MRTIVALIVAALAVAFYAALIWIFLAFIWPVLPPWLAMLCFIAVAVFGIGSPIWWLARWSDRKLPAMRRNHGQEDGK